MVGIKPLPSISKVGKPRQDNVSFAALYADGSASSSIVQPGVTYEAGFC